MKPLILAALLSCSAIVSSASFAWPEEACPTAVPAGCGSECQSAYRDYAAAIGSQRWDIPLYKKFLERFDEVSVQVKAKSESGDSFVKSMCLTEWYASYKYRETQMDRKTAWDGVAKMFETERADYMKGQSEAKMVYADLAGKQDWKDGGQLKKELGRRLSSRYGKSVLSQDRDGDGKRLFPGALAAEDLRTIDFLYVYLSTEARDSLDSSSCAKNGKCPQGLAQNIDQRNRAQQRGEKAVADAGIAAPVFSAPFLGDSRAVPPSPPTLPSAIAAADPTAKIAVDAPARTAAPILPAKPAIRIGSTPPGRPVSTSQAAAGANPRIDERTPPPLSPARAPSASISAAPASKPAASSTAGQVKAPPAPVAATETLRSASAAPKKQIAGARRVVFIGDSHSAQYFGRTLDRDLRSKGDLVATFAVAGSMPSAWTSGAELCMGSFFKVDARLHQRTEETRKNDAGKTCVKTPQFADIVTEYKPDVVIIALGSNGAADAASLLGILRLRSAPSRPACFWVGPPRMRAVKDASLNSRYGDLTRAGITDSSSPIDACRLVDSRRLSYLRYPAKGCDGIHYNCSDLIPLAKHWGHDVYGAVTGSQNKQ